MRAVSLTAAKAALFILALASGLGTAAAADMPVKAKPHAVYNWSGWYAGVNLGYSWGKSATDFSLFNATTGAALTSGSNSFDMNGAIGGLQLGFNRQKDQWVWGIEADWQLSGQKGDTSFSCPGAICAFGATAYGAAAANPAITTYSQKLDWFATLRGRIGATITPASFAYVTGGLAVGHVKTDGTLTGFVNVAPPANNTAAAFSSSATKAGWVIGAGVETQLSDRWTGKIEYLYMDLGRVDTTATNTNAGILVPLRAQFSSRITDNILRVGLNYKFN